MDCLNTQLPFLPQDANRNPWRADQSLCECKVTEEHSSRTMQVAKWQPPQLSKDTNAEVL